MSGLRTSALADLLPGAAEGLPKPLSIAEQVEDAICDVADNAVANLKEAGRGDAQKYVPTVLYPRVQWGMEHGTGMRRWGPRPQLTTS